MRSLITIFVVSLLIAGCSQVNPENTNVERGHVPNYVQVKYRSDPVDIAHPSFVYQSTSRSSFIRGAWYDENNQYMVISLSGTNYHYCGMPGSTWNQFRRADSFGKTYNSVIKGRYDCRVFSVPSY